MRQGNKSPSIWQGWIIAALVLVAFALRTYRLGAQSLWYDEGYSIWLVGRGLAEITSALNPPLFHFTLHFWLRLTGTTEFAARFHSLIPGLLIIPLTYALGRRLIDAPTGILAALIVTTSPFLLLYSQEVRMYALAGFLVTLSSYLLLRALSMSVPSEGLSSADREDNRTERPCPSGLSLWIGYTIATIAAVYTHYYTFLILPVHGFLVLWWAWRYHWPQPVVQWLTTQGGLILAFLPWTPFLLHHFRTQNITYWPGILSLSFILRRALFTFVGGGLLDDRTAQWVAVGYLALSLIGLTALVLRPLQRVDDQRKKLLSAQRSSTSPAIARSPLPAIASSLFLLAYLVIPLLFTFALTHKRPKFFPRYLLFAAPALFVLTAAGIRAFLPSRTTRGRMVSRYCTFALALCLLLSPSALALRNWFFDPHYGKDDFRAVGQYLEATIAPDEAVILSSGHAFPVFTYYYHGANWYPIPPHPTPAPSAIDPLPPSIGSELNQIAAGHRGLWLVLWQSEVVDPNDVLTTLLDLVGTRLPVTETFRGIEVRHYSLPPNARFPEEAQPKRRLDASLTQEVLLLGYDVLNDPIPSGGAADLVLFWRALHPMEADYRISLRLKDQDGHQVSQLDRRPVGFMYPTHLWKSGEEVMGRHALPLPPGLPPGTYTLDLLFYPASDILDAQSLELGQLTVTRPEHPPPLDGLNIPYRRTVAFGPLVLLGHDLASADALPGDIVEVTLFWQAVSNPSADYEPVAILGEDRTVPLTFSYPTSHWQTGDVFRTHHWLTLPADLPSGETQVRIRVDTPERKALAPPATLAVLRVGSREHNFNVPTDIQHRLRADLGGHVTFLGYELDTETLKPGAALHLTLYWRTQQEMNVSYRVFTHLLGNDGLVWGQQDSTPLQGTRPTTSWLPGEVLADTYTLTLHPGAPAGDYQIEVGMYEPLTGERLPVFDDSGCRLPDDRILLGQVRVER